MIFQGKIIITATYFDVWALKSYTALAGSLWKGDKNWLTLYTSNKERPHFLKSVYCIYFLLHKHLSKMPDTLKHSELHFFLVSLMFFLEILILSYKG